MLFRSLPPASKGAEVSRCKPDRPDLPQLLFLSDLELVLRARYLGLSCRASQVGYFEGIAVACWLPCVCPHGDFWCGSPEAWSAADRGYENTARAGPRPSLASRWRFSPLSRPGSFRKSGGTPGGGLPPAHYPRDLRSGLVTSGNESHGHPLVEAVAG